VDHVRHRHRERLFHVECAGAAAGGEFRVLRYDLRGQGGTPVGKGTMTIDMLVADLVLLWGLARHREEPLVGLGLGGAIAQGTAIRYAVRVDRLVPCCCRAQMVPEFAALWQQLITTVTAKGIEPIVEPTIERWFPAPSGRPIRRSWTRCAAWSGAPARRATSAAPAHSSASRSRTSGRLIKARTLYLSGADDHRGGPSELMAGLAAKVPGARHAAIPDAAHIAKHPETRAASTEPWGDFLREN